MHEVPLLRRAQHETPRRLQRAIGAVGALADRGFLSMLAGGLLALTGRAGRRAALHGAAAHLTAGILANGVLKRVSNRPRPDAVARERGFVRGRRRPTTSLPSGHTASACAFAVAASAAVPAAAPALAGLALVVGTHRVLSGEHYPSDVAIGAVVGLTSGAAVAVAARRYERMG